MPTPTGPLPTLEELGGCEFMRPDNKNGYAHIFYKGKQRKAHRVVWEKAYGEIPKGMHIDHICHNVAIANEMCLGEFKCIHRSCVNINHLRILTPRDNQLEGLRGLKNRAKCSNGHDLTIEGSVIVRNRPEGKTGQLCKECYLVNARASSARHRAKKKAMAV